MAYKKDHNLFVGGKYGCFKGLQCRTSGIISKNLQNVQYISQDSHITVMKWANEQEKELLLATANQTVKVYNTKCKSFIQNIPVNLGKGPICGVTRYKGTLITAVESGQIRIWCSDTANTVVTIDPEDLDMSLPNEEDNMFVDINTGGSLSCMQHSPYDENKIGSGGKYNDLKLWDLNTSKNIFSAKNLPDDAVRLTEEVWVSDIAFLPDSNRVAVCSRFGYVRLYDPRAQRKPTCAVKVPEEALTCLAACDDYNFICGLAKGNMIRVDTRMKAVAGKYKGYLGAVRSIALHPTAPYVASVSLDRFVRIHHRDTKELLAKEYLKLPLHCVVMRSEFDLTAEVKSGRKRKQNDDELEEFDSMLDSLEKVEEPKSSKKMLLVNPFASTSSTLNREPSRKEGNDSNGIEKEEKSEGDDDDSDDSDDNELDDDDSDEPEDDDCIIED